MDAVRPRWRARNPPQYENDQQAYEVSYDNVAVCNHTESEGDVMVSSDRKRFTASVREQLVDLVDQHAAKLEVTRSDVIEQAMEMWLQKQSDLEEEAYFQQAAEEMNADAKDWNTLTNSYKQVSVA